MAITVVTSDGLIGPGNDKIKFTPEGGQAVRLTNKTGAASVLGQLVEASTTTDDAFQISDASSSHPIGVVYEAGVADGSECWVVVSGIADVLLKDSTSATHGNWVYTSDTSGRVDATLATPPGGGIPELDQHMREIGHCLESDAGGTDITVKCIVHFN